MKVGDILRNERESKGLTVQAVADAIHLSVRQIDALETNDFGALPEPVTTRGFIRSYAKFLETDSEPLLSNYRELVPHQNPNAIVMNSNVNKVISVQEQSPWLMYILGSIVVLLLLVVWFYYMDNVNDWTVDNDDTIVAMESETITPSEVVESPVTGEVDAVEAPAVGEVQTSGLVNETAEASLVSAPPLPVDANGNPINEPLVLTLAEDCWVSIKTLDGKKVFEKLLPAGTVKGFEVAVPFKLKIGNASAAKASYLTKPLALASYTKGSVARLTVNDKMLDALTATEMRGASVSAVEAIATQEHTMPVDSPNALVINTNDKCWVSVKTLAGKKVFEGLLPPQSQKVISIAKPFKLTIGNASEAKASYVGASLDLTVNTQHNVANLMIK